MCVCGGRLKCLIENESFTGNVVVCFLQWRLKHLFIRSTNTEHKVQLEVRLIQNNNNNTAAKQTLVIFMCNCGTKTRPLHFIFLQQQQQRCKTFWTEMISEWKLIKSSSLRPQRDEAGAQFNISDKRRLFLDKCSLLSLDSCERFKS